MGNLELNMFISIRAICYYEKLTKCSFVDFEKDYEKNILYLLYSILISHPENKFNYTFEQANDKFFSDNKFIELISKKFVWEQNFFAQFGNLFYEINSKDNINTEEQQPFTIDNHIFIYQLVPLLVNDCHLDIKYVLDEMFYTDIELFLSHSYEIHQEKLEEDRLWTYFTMLPHINTKKSSLHKPEDLMPFPWDAKQKEKADNDKLTKDAAYLKSIGFKFSNTKH